MLDSDRLLATRRSIVAHGPEHFNMQWWFRTPSNSDAGGLALSSTWAVDINQCGTTACMAGHAVLVHDKGDTEGDVLGNEIQVARWLGVWPWVFYDQQWPDWAKQRINIYGEYRAALDLIDALVAFGECPANPDDLPSPVRA